MTNEIIWRDLNIIYVNAKQIPSQYRKYDHIERLTRTRVYI